MKNRKHSHTHKRWKKKCGLNNERKPTHKKTAKKAKTLSKDKSYVINGYFLRK